MFKSGRWRSEKKKIRMVFKLQFHATEVKADELSICVGSKSTGKSEKALVLDSHCRWESPVFETVTFLQDAKTAKLNSRIYPLTVSSSSSSSGSTKSGFVGETSIDFADYVDAFNTCNVSLPLHSPNPISNSKPMLHVSIQRQPETPDPQSYLKQEDKKSRPQDLKSHLSIESDEYHISDSQQESPFAKVARIAALRRRASIESDTTLSSFGSISELGEVESRGDHIHSPMPNHSATNVYDDPHISESDWSATSDQGISTDDSLNSSNDTIPTTTTTTSSSSSSTDDKLVALARRADLSELELQSLRKQIVKETKRSQDLLREVTCLKQERDSLKADCESNKASDKQKEEAKIRNKLQCEGRDPQALFEQTREELDYEKDVNSNLRLQLEKTQESNAALVLAVQDLEAMLGQRSKKPEESRRRCCTSETDDDEDQKALDELVKGHMDAKEAHVLEQRITDLYNDIEIYKRDKEELEIQVEQLALDYEILKQENHDISYKLEQSQVQEQLKMQYECSSSFVNVNELEKQVEGLESKLEKQSEDFSESLCRIKELEMQINGMEEELEKQAQVFEADIEAVTRAKVEQEQRAIEAEEALRKTREKNASVASKIQDEFKRISAQMSFTFAANEKMAVKAMSETQELRMQKRQLEELLMNANDELRANKVEYEAKLSELSEKTDLKMKEMEKLLKDEKCKHLENQKRQEEDVNADLNQGSEFKTKDKEMANLENTTTAERIMEERIKLLEEQYKLKGNALEASSKMFIEKEKDLKNQIKALETKLNELSKNSQETSEPLHGSDAIAAQSREALPRNKSDNLQDLVSEVASLREQNGLMETELKEMQERYSEISLRFAQVEGERQQLVMNVRYLKNAKKS